MRSVFRTFVLVAAAVTAATVVHADSRIEKTLKLAPGGKFFLDSQAGSVEVQGVARDGVRVVITATSDDLAEQWTFEIQELQGEARLIARRKGSDGKSSWFGGWFNSERAPKFVVEVPSKADVEVDTGGGSVSVRDLEGAVAVDTSGGAILVEKVRGNARLDTAGGSIKVSGLDGSVLADTSGGSIRIAGVTGDIKADTSGGSISLDAIAGLVDADTSGGSISATFAKGNNRGGRLETSGGSIRVALDPTIDLRIDAEASGGGVSSELELTSTTTKSRSHLSGTFGKGGQVLRVETSGGSISIEPIP
ncbi:MAG TPA: DUF4097 family beta strand repeat-containing protein [Candidatus Polarisedimenticolaceae bacterium]